jgi:hypothetical protein
MPDPIRHPASNWITVFAGMTICAIDYGVAYGVHPETPAETHN